MWERRGSWPRKVPGRAQADIYALGKVLYEMTTGFFRPGISKITRHLEKFTGTRAAK